MSAQIEARNVTKQFGDQVALRDFSVDVAPGEIFGEIGAAVRDASPAATTIFAGYCGGVLGYVATPEYNKFFSWLGFDGAAHDVAAAFARGDRKATAAAMRPATTPRAAAMGSTMSQ